MSRISYLRKTPEGWQETVKRMIRLHYVELEPDQARAIVRYLSNRHTLAPAEARPVFYEAEKRSRPETLPENENFKSVCTGCHVAARALGERRTEEEWRLLKGMHLGYFPRAPFLGEPLPEKGEPDAFDPEDDEEDRSDRAFAFLAREYPMETPEWQAFRAKATVPDLTGRWLLTTHAPGTGLVTGELQFERSGEDYRTRAVLRLPDGRIERREGKGILYAGYNWRGTSSGPSLGDNKEVLMLSEDGARFDGRFYRGAFGDLGLDVSITRLGDDVRIAGVFPRALPAGGGEASLKILGANFPENVTSEAIALGSGVAVTSIAARSAGVLEVRVEVDEDALPAMRNASVGAATAIDAFAVYDGIDYVRVLPEDPLARLGGVKTPKQFVQFEARAYHRGPDGERMTDDDLDLGLVAADWRLEEYHIRPDDDDLGYVGEIDARGLFTPNIDGPNLDRKGNNTGDVWVVASYVPPGASRPLKGRAHLVVTVPIYTLWDFFPEAAR